MKIKNKVILIFVILCIVLICPIISLAAKIDDEPKIEKGWFSYVTTDKRGTSKIRWGNVGYNIAFAKNSGDPTKVKHITVMLDETGGNNEAWKQIQNLGNGYNRTEYRISEDLIEQEFDKKYGKGYYADHARDGGVIYFSNIFMVYRLDDNDNRIPWQGPFHKLTDIQTPSGFTWPPATMADFPKHFDIPVPYTANTFPTEVVYYVEGTKTIISSSKLKTKDKEGTEIDYTLAKTKTYKNKNYTLVQSYNTELTTQAKKYNVKNVNEFLSNMEQVQKQKGTMKKGGLLFVGIMRKKDTPPKPDIGVEKREEFLNPVPTAAIQADNREAEKYDVLEGIPTTENLYVSLFTPEYLSGYEFKSITGTRDYKVSVSKTYNLSWTETSYVIGADGVPIPIVNNFTDTQTEVQKITITRKYFYWLIEKLDVFGVKESTISNYALPNEQVNIQPYGYTPPIVEVRNSKEEKDHIFNPVYKKTIVLPSSSVSRNGTRPNVPYEDFTDYAEREVGEIQVKNDKLIFNQKIIMSDEIVKTKGEEPKELPLCEEDIDENVFYKKGLTIEENKLNGEFGSRASVSYYRIASVNSIKNEFLTYDAEEVNSVVIHTPVVADAMISDNKEFNQMLKPEESMGSIVLDQTFSIYFPTVGLHKDIKGYGYRDYSKYTECRQAKFPIDVYINETFIPAGNWFDITTDSSTFYLPIWVDEGKYTLQFRAISINTHVNGKIKQEEYMMNEELQNYVAIDTIQVEVSGRLYGLSLYDISDYPIWQSVFRKPKSLQKTGFDYRIGINDRNGKDTGRNPQYTLPLVNGSHPTYKAIGTIKLGYMIRFSLTTIGNMYQKNDYIKITPSFYYINKDGTNRIKADIYYSETFGDKKNVMVKVGSLQDNSNIKTIRAGDSYLAIPEEELITTAKINGNSLKNQKNQKSKVYTFSNIMIPNNLRTFIGTNYAPGNKIPFGVESDKVTKSMQKWYCEYYLPSEIHVVPEGYDILKYISENGGINYQEPFWLKEGYVIVNFSIETIANKEKHLSYINHLNEVFDYCNMWRKEGYQNKKMDWLGNKFEFWDGDLILYDTDQSAAIDYRSRGTH